MVPYYQATSLNNAIVENDGIIAQTLQEELFRSEEREASGFFQDDKYLQAIVTQNGFRQKHIPKINGEIPPSDVANSNHQRLLNRLQIYNLMELQIEGDGNCQFRALSDQLYRTSEHHKFVREQVVNQLKSSQENYQGYVPMSYEDYLKKMSKDGEWGDHVTLQAASDLYGVKIFILTSFKDTCYIELLPDVEKSKRVLCLSFWAEVHYNSIYPIEGTNHQS